MDLTGGKKDFKHVSIIGAGVGGLTLALLLHREGIEIDVYESGDEMQAPVVGPTVALAPNCLRLLDDLGVYQRVCGLGYSAERSVVLNESLEQIDSYCLGDRGEFGYAGLRIYRHELVDYMRQLLVESGAGKRLHWRSKFSGVIKDDENGVCFVAGGSQLETDFLIGADGIHSSVRKEISSHIPQYTGTLVVMGVISEHARRLLASNQKDFTLPCSVTCKKGSFMINPQRPDLSEILGFRQIPGYPEQSRAGWESLAEDKDELVRLLRGDLEEWPVYVQTAMEAVSPSHISIWAVHMLPDLDRWMSTTKGVIVVGDAAHAMPPSSGQGAAQAIEDSYALGMLLSRIRWRDLDTSFALHLWESRRRQRIANIKEVARQNYIRRLPQHDRGKEADAKIGSLESMRWLQGHDVRIEFGDGEILGL